MSLRLNDAPVMGLAYRKAEALLVYLAATGRPQPRDALATLLWNDVGLDRGLNNLRVLLSHLRPRFGSYFDITRQTITFRRDQPHHFDVATFERNLATRRHARPDLAALEAATALYQGDFLSGFYVRDAPLFEDWMIAERVRLQQLLLSTLHVLAGAALEGRRFGRAAELAGQMLMLDPFHEETIRLHMRALAGSGQTVAALAQYDRWRRQLMEEVEGTPADETTALADAIRAGCFVVDNADNHVLPAQHPGPHTNIPDAGMLHGREEELSQLQHWVVDTHERVVMVVGMGGIGKTSLVARFAEDVRHQFAHVLWVSLLNAPPLDDLIRDWIETLAGTSSTPHAESLDTRLATGMMLFRQKRVLLVLDNMETILLHGERAGAFRDGYEGYSQLIAMFSQTRHRSTLLLTTREQPLVLVRLGGPATRFRSLMLDGLATPASEAILAEHQIPTGVEREQIVERYSGNPLALHLVASTIQELFGGDARAFLRSSTLIFDDIRDVLNAQWSRLTPLEHSILFWLAVEREPVSLSTLEANLQGREARHDVLEAVRSLRRRALLEQHGTTFTLQNVLLEYTTERFLAASVEEIETGRLHWFAHHLLLKAQSREYVRHMQRRLLLEPYVARLRARHGQAGMIDLLDNTLATIRATPMLAASYAATNVLHALLASGQTVEGYDFRGLHVQQADLSGVALPGVDFAHADLSNALFTEKFRVIYQLAWSPDSTSIAGCSVDGAIRIWHAADGRLVNRFSCVERSMYALDWSRDGRLIAGAYDDGTICVWEVETATLLMTLPGHDTFVGAVCFSVDSSLLASGGDDHTVCVWDIATGALLHRLRDHRESVTAVAWSPVAPVLATSGWDTDVRLWDATNGMLIATMSGHTHFVESLAWNDDGSLLASASWDTTVRLWDTRDFTTHLCVTGHMMPVLAVAFQPQQRVVASGGDDMAIRMWDADTGRVLHTLYGHVHTVNALAWSHDGAMLASAGGDLTIRFWEGTTGNALHTLRATAPLMRWMQFMDDGSVVVGDICELTVRLWRIADPRSSLPSAEGILVHELRGHRRWLSDLHWSADGGILASASWDGTVRLWDIRTGKPLWVFHGHTDPVMCVAVNASGRYVASGGWDQTIRIWDVRTGHTIHTLRGHADRVVRLAWSADDRTLASGSYDRTVRLWDIETGMERGRLEHQEAFVIGLAFSSDGKTLVRGVGQANISLWDYHTLTHLQTVSDASDGDIFCFALSPDGNWLAFEEASFVVRVVDTTTGATVCVLPRQSAEMRALAFSGDGLLACGRLDEVVTIWNVRTGLHVRTVAAPTPYRGMNINEARGLTDAQRSTLLALGAVEDGTKT